MTATRALTADGTVHDSPDAEQLYDLLSELNLTFPFLVVERADGRDPEQHYIQVHLAEDGSCLVEHRDGGPDQHFRTVVGPPYAMKGHDEVAALVTSWARDDGEWRQRGQWQRVRV
ncbi:hypothetical protein ACH4Q6_17510 [Streptomyces lydicus]|uniref:hypothetical protein n=1 Tax=Streptomyces lydicus TaxID=47763 RepID=UPI0037BCCFF8